MFTLIVLATLAQPPAADNAPSVGMPPVQGLASIDPKGNLTLWRITPSCYGMLGQTVDAPPGEKKDKDDAPAKA
jgi:hypothetical protein